MYIIEKNNEIIWFLPPLLIILLLVTIKLPINNLTEDNKNSYMSSLFKIGYIYIINTNIVNKSITEINKTKINIENEMKIKSLLSESITKEKELKNYIKLETSVLNKPKNKSNLVMENTNLYKTKENLGNYTELELKVANMPEGRELYWPVLSSKIHNEFKISDNPVFEIEGIHKGIIIEIEEEMVVKSSINSKVISIDIKENNKYSIILQRKDGLRVKYDLLTKIFVSEGEIVNEGDKIGEAKENINFEISVDNHSVDPMWFSYH